MFGFPASLASIFAALRKHVELILFAIALVAAALLVRSWLGARQAAAQLAATLAAQQKIIADASARQSARDAALSQTLAQIDALKRAVQTPRQAGAALAQSLPQFIAGPLGAPLPAPLQFIPYPTSTSASGQSAAAPTSPGASSNAASSDASTANLPGAPPQQNVVILSGTKDPSATGTSGAIPQNLGPLSSLKSEISNLRSGHPVSSIPASAAADNSANAAPQQGSAATVQPCLPSVASAQGGLPCAASTQQGSASTPIPGSICIPPADLKPLYDSIENCEACAAKLTAAQADLSDETTKFTAASTERDAALKAARGTFWTRTARAAKWIAIGAAAGAIIAKYH
jgi:hypothetical protein